MKALKSSRRARSLSISFLLVGVVASACSADLEDWIVFNSSQDGDGDIWAVQADGTGLTQLVDMPGHQGGPKWSPDSRKIVYAYESEAQLWVYDWFTGTNTKIYDGDDYGGQFYVTGPVWSPDGNRILFCEQTTYNDPHITVINSDGTNPHIISTEEGYVGGPSWSQSGTAFVYTRRSDGTASDDLWIYDFTATKDIQNGMNHRLTQGAGEDSPLKYEPDWAPNARIAFSYDHDLAIIDPGHSPDWADPASPDIVSLTTDAGYYTPSWSPDSTHLVYSLLKDGDTDLWTMDLSTLVQTRLISLPGGQATPDWGNPVPVPGAALLGYLGLGTAAAVLRRRNQTL